MTTELPEQHEALVLRSVGAAFEHKSVRTPRPTHGSAVVQVLAAGIVSYAREIYGGVRPYPFPTPLIGGTSCVARVAALGPDATSLKEGQLVWVDCMIRARDDPTSEFLSAIHHGGTEGSQKLMREVWRDGPWAKYANAPLENCIALNENTLCKEMGYSFEDLAYLSNLLVAYGGLRDIRVEPGDTVVVCPATGGFGGAGVLVALAMGARVIAMGRNTQELLRIREYATRTMTGGRVENVGITGNEEADTKALQAFGTIDKILDLTPPHAADATHLKSALMALRKEGSASLMGFANFTSSPAIRWNLVANNITLKGRFMYSRDDMIQFVKMLERGLLPKSNDLVQPKAFSLEQWDEALNAAAEWTGLGRFAVFRP